MVNEKLLLDTLEYIETHPQQWNQRMWYSVYDSEGNPVWDYVDLSVEEVNSCNTSFCFAGHAAMKMGFPAPPEKMGYTWEDENGLMADEFARRHLGLSYGQADILFDMDNTLEDLRAIVKAIIDDPEIGSEQLAKVTSWRDDYYYVD